MSDTLNGLERLAQTTSEKNVVVWLNEYFGEVIKDGQPFDEFKTIEEYASKLVGTVVIRERNPHTYGDDVRQNAGTPVDVRRGDPKRALLPGIEAAFGDCAPRAIRTTRQAGYR